MDDIVIGDDGIARCRWGAAPPEYCAYHDTEWGRPVDSEDAIFEKLCLEGFQAGLSWLTILRKRANFRKAFAGFDPDAVARFGANDVERLLADPGIVRHRRKITAAIANAEATVALAAEGLSLAALVWRYAPEPAPAPVSFAEVPAATAESTALSKELRQRGFRFVGPTTVYAAMQSLGLANDHLSGCEVRDQVVADRATFTVPR